MKPMYKRKRAALVLLTVMLLCMTVFSSEALASGEPTPKPTAKPTATPTATPVITPMTTPAASKTLTPGGNLTLVDDLSGVATNDKQFITVITKNGNYFYIIIDRAGSNENVYFLNTVDEMDLMQVLEDAGYEIEATPTPTPTPKPTANPDGSQNMEAEKDNSPLLMIGLLAAAAIGVFVYFKKKKSAPAAAPRMEDYAYEEDDDDEELEEDDAPSYSKATVKKGNWDGIV